LLHVTFFFVVSVTELQHLSLCVHKAYFHRKAFLIDSRFTQYFFRVGLKQEEIMQLESFRNQLEVDLWRLELQKKSTTGYANKWKRLVNTFLEKDSGFMNYLLASYTRHDIELSPVNFAFIEELGIRASMSVQDITKHRSDELKTLYFERQKAVYKNIDEKVVDWLMVARDMVTCINFLFINLNEVCVNLWNKVVYCRQHFVKET